MDGVKIDVDWVRGYAKQVDKATADVNKVRDDLKGHDLGADAFGDLGRQVGTGEAYAHAAEMLTQQIERASQMLASASKGLGDTVNQFAGGEDDALAHVKRADHRR